MTFRCRLATVAALAASMLAGTPAFAWAAEMKIIAAAATASGFAPLMELYVRRGGDPVKVDYATGPEIQARLDAGEKPDIVILPEATIKALGEAGKVAGAPVKVGRIGMSMGVRRGASQPDISTMDGLKQALTRAKSVIYSRAVSGLYMEGLIRRLGLEAETAPRVVQVSNGDALVDRLASGSGDEIGFTSTTELKAGEPKGIVLAAPLPDEAQNYTTAVAAALPDAAGRPEVAKLLAFIDSAESRALLLGAGLD